jgi:hypothetical protein
VIYLFSLLAALLLVKLAKEAARYERAHGREPNSITRLRASQP